MASREPVLVGIDVGGTSIKLGLVRGMRILEQRTLPTGPIARPARMQEGLTRAVQQLLREAGLKAAGVGVGVPGLVEYPGGIVRSCANIPGWDKVPLRAALSRKLRLPVQVDNDVNVMTLAEWTYGAGKGFSDLVCMTLGTGVGGGLVLGGRLHRGWLGSAGEIGHMPLAEEGVHCSCGGTACLERTVGNKEILAWVKQQLQRGAHSRLNAHSLTHEAIDQACEQGDRLALDTWKRVGQKIGYTLVGVVNLLNPERIVIGGGIAKAGKWVFEPMRETVRSRAMRGPNRVSIVPAKLGSSAGLIGAALLGRAAE